MDSIPVRTALRESFVRGMTKGGVYFALLILVIVSGIISPKMLEPSYILEVLKVASILGIISIGQTLLILSRGIDLSVGVHMTLVMILIDGISMGRPENTLLALIVALLVGLAVGAINGLLVVKFEIEPLVGSLGVMTLLIGVSFVYTKGFAKGIAPPLLNFLGSGRLLGFFPVHLDDLISSLYSCLVRRCSVNRRNNRDHVVLHGNNNADTAELTLGLYLKVFVGIGQ